MSGIAAIRIQVSVLGTFQGMVVLVAGMQVIIKAPCERCADTGHLLEVGRSRAQYALQAPEVPQQGAALRRPQARYRFEHRFVVATRAPPAVPADGKAVRFVAN